MAGKRILVVDDESRIREVVQYALEREGFSVVQASSSEEAARALAGEPLDLIVLDIMLPDGNGLDLCREYRRTRRTPILFLSSRGEEIDRVLGLEMGADDYLSKPFGTRELVARIKAVLRRSEPQPPEGERTPLRLEQGDLSLDVERHEVRVRGNAVNLTHLEFCLLRTLLDRPEVVFERGQLLRDAWPDDAHITERTIDTHVRRIRGKLSEHGIAPIATIHGVGYKLVRDRCRVAEGTRAECSSD